jgi:hypothetical protein
MGKVFERVVTVFLENTMRSSALANPYLNSLRKKGVFMTNAQGVTHPSQPNYIASIAGDTMGIVDDHDHYMAWSWTGNRGSDPDCKFEGSYDCIHPKEGFSPTTIVDLLEAHNLNWKCYVEDLPSDYIDNLTFDPTKSPECNLKTVPPDAFPFARKHVPFLSFPNVVAREDRLKKIVNADQFEKDLTMASQSVQDNLPHYSFYVPNLINDGHYISMDERRRPAHIDIDLGPNNALLDNMTRFLQSFLGDDPVSKFPPETLIVITFDEAYPYMYDYGIYTLLIGDFLEAGTINSDPVNHYTLLRSIEDNFGLGTLKRHDAMATPYWFLR